MDIERHKEFIDFFLNRNDWLKAGLLANHFAVSSRTIRKWISLINSNQTETPLILSSSSGYKINPSAYKKYKELLKENDTYYQTPEKRIYYILNQLVINSDGLSIFDLSDSIFISEPTLENDLRKAKPILELFNLSIRHSGELIIMEGMETNKRKLMTYIFYQECNTKILNLKSIEEAFGYDLGEFKEKMLGLLRDHNLYVNEYTIGNILVHIMITTQRIKKHHIIRPQNLDILSDKKEYQAAEAIAKLIESQFDVCIDSFELYNLAAMLISKTTILRQDILNRQNLSEYMDAHEITLVEQVLKKVYENYMVSLYDDQFLIRFMLHVHNLIIRAHHKQSAKNPLAKQVKATYPLIYDLAVYISNDIQKEESIEISEDEIAYVAFHIAAFLEQKKITGKRISCTIICLDYYDTHKTMIDRINHYFDALLDIQRVYTTIDSNFTEINTELVISTVELPADTGAEVIVVSPFLKETEIDLINSRVLQLKKKKEHNRLKKQLIQLFNPQIFHQNLYRPDVFQMIQSIGAKMVECGFIEENYIDDVIEREKMSSTVFNNNVAVPHSMHMNAIKSSISIVINDKPVEWGNQRAQIIALIAFNKKERDIFVDIFDHFIRIISEPENVQKLIHSKNYDHFIDILISLIE
ncbi:BglG family transcription antiterminator [Sinanaerobacter chloroacetimidivorans]|uniref:PRD domain-containing protein n=1 Tax=Sinanaerobacter chloroacetimidivorans TaxID=2818044 RepID=A0A8J7W5Y0_9FIRM|nr:PTS sugar transporter subunit IIA [Sinanaerobacter chloroacetimidivorans]MBR0599790.1 PRD domain-containing protein [Sinanaerobacter chloroacetimidivorans]